MIGWLLQLGSEDRSRRAVKRRPSRPGPPGWSRRELLTLRRSKPKPDGLWRVRIDADRCSDCAACTRICDRAALSRREEDAFVVYLLDAARCDGCGNCREICAERALSLARADQAATILEVTRLAVAECSRCGRRSAGLIKDLCAICRQENRRLGGPGSGLR